MARGKWKLALASLFFNGPTTALFVYFRSFQTQIYRKTVGISGIQTRIVGVEGEHADHLTTTTAHIIIILTQCPISVS